MNGIIIYTKPDYEKNHFFVKKSKECMKEYEVELQLVFAEDILFENDIVNNHTFNDKYIISNVNKPDFAIVRCINPTLSKMLELYGIKIFNTSIVSEIANHKFFAYLLAKKCNIKTIPTIYCPNKLSTKILKDSFEALNYEELIAKTVSGHGGSEVFCFNKDNIQNVIMDIKNKGLCNEKYVIQPRIKGIAKDVRVYMLDNKPVSAILRCSPSDYRSNYSLGGEVKEINIDDKLSNMVKELTKEIYLDYAGIDFIIDENAEYYFNEIEDVVGARMLYACTDIDIISRFMHHIIDKVRK